jgi:serine/threonine-protein kinase
LEELLDRIEASPGFSRSAGLNRFLRYVALETLEGRGEKIKEYTIAVEVFGRQSYDPQVDSLVRVQASLLRQKLEQYYATDGRSESLVIAIPKGGYKVTFVETMARENTAAGSEARPFKAGAKHVILSYAKRLPLQAATLALLSFTALVGVWQMVHFPGSTSAAKTSIAVLPFADASPGGDQSLLADGIAEELIHSLGAIPGLRVVARASAFQYRKKAQDIRRIAKDLTVTHVVKGSVRREESILKVTAEVINADTGNQVWSAAYERRIDELLAVEEEIAQAITSSLRAREFDRGPTPGGTASPEAYRHYMTGKYWRVSPTLENLNRALKEFRAAIDADAKYGLAHAALAESVVRLRFTETLSTNDDLEKSARQSVRRALELDDLSGAAHEAAALVHLLDWDFFRAGKEFRRAVQVEPSNVRVRFAFAQLLLSPGLHYADSADQLKTALEWDPVSANLITELGATYRMNHQFDAAMVEFRRSLDLNPHGFGTRTNMAALDVEAGRSAEGIKLLEAVNTENPGDPWVLGHLGYAYAKAGRSDDARAILATLRKTSTAALHIAAVQMGLGLDQAALDTLEEGAERRAFSLLWLRTDFRFAPLHRQPRYLAVCARLP